MIIVMKKPKQQCVFSVTEEPAIAKLGMMVICEPLVIPIRNHFRTPNCIGKLWGMCPIIGATIDSMDMLECSSTFWQWNIAARIPHGNIYCNSIQCHDGPQRLQEGLSDFLDKVPGVLTNRPHRNGRKIRRVSSCLSANSEATKEAKLVALATLLGVAVSSLVESWFSVLRGWWQPPARWPWGLKFPEMMGNNNYRTSPSSYWKHD